MGDVYLAEQEHPARQVAIKILRAGLPESAKIRFSRELEAHGAMDHPYVARVYDSGTTKDGRPFIAMELVDGDSITGYCARRRLDVAARLRLFCRVCEAIQHAHQKGVVHRDIKPSNVLIREEGGGQPKVIDFGIAKALGVGVVPAGGKTLANEILGTPDYMSPEQTRPGVHFDTRSDVYSLGALLNELLSGVPPFGSGAFEGQSIDDALDTIRNAAPIPPSRRAPDLRRQLEGDVDAIVAKALAKQPDERYASPLALAEDVARHLEGQPVLAAKPSSRYRAGKFVRRHRVAVGLAVAAFLVLAAFAGLMHIQAKRIAAERDRANREAESARRVSAFLTTMIESADPRRTKGLKVTVRDALASGVSQIRSDTQLETGIRGRLLNTMGQVYMALGVYDEAQTLLEDGLAQRIEAWGRHNVEVAESLIALGGLRNRTGELDKAEGLFTEALAIVTDLGGPKNPGTANALNGLADMHWYRNELDLAKPLYEQVLEIRRESGTNEPDYAKTVKDLADIAFVQGDYHSALPLYKDALYTLEARLGSGHPDLVAIYTNLGYMLLEHGQFDAARPLLHKALEVGEKVWGPNHFDLVGPLSNQGRMLLHDGRYEEARLLFDRSLKLARSISPTHPDVALSLDHLGYAYLLMGDDATAERTLNEALQVWRQNFDDDHLDCVMTEHRLAIIKARRGANAEAHRLFDRVLALRDEKLGPVHPELADVLESYAEYLSRTGDKARASGMLKRAASIRSALANAPLVMD